MPTSARTIRLIERRSRLCRLPREDLDFLLAHHRSHLDVTPTHRRGVCRLTPRGHIGVIDAPGTRFDIEPKIPLANVLYLLDPDNALTLPPIVEGHSCIGLIDVLAQRFAALLAERVTAGLRRGYVERDESLPYLRGRLDVAAELRAASPVRDKLHCRFDELCADTPWNRQVKAVTRMLLGSPFASGALRQSMAAFADVSDVVASDTEIAGMLNDVDFGDYRPLLELCRLLRTALEGGGVRPAFLIDLERVFEHYVTQGVRRAFAESEIQVDAQPWLGIHGPTPPRWPQLGLRPDIVVRRGEQVLAVIDVKWKHLRRGPEPGDVHQALAYASVLRAERVILLYPGDRNSRRDYDIAGIPKGLGLHRLRVNGSRERCAAALREWAELI